MSSVELQAVETGTCFRKKELQLVERVCPIKNFCIQFNCAKGGVDTGAATGILFRMLCMGGAVCTGEKLCVA